MGLELKTTAPDAAKAAGKQRQPLGLELMVELSFASGERNAMN
jgi:hypothetical protein